MILFQYLSLIGTHAHKHTYSLMHFISTTLCLCDKNLSIFFFYSFILNYACCVCACAHMCIYTFVYKHVESEFDTGHLLSFSSFIYWFILRQCLSFNLEVINLARLAGQWALEICLSTCTLLPLVMWLQTGTAGSGFSHRCWGSNSTPHACVTSTSTEPCP